MQHYWSGGFIPQYGSSLIRYYVDGEKAASVVLPLAMGHGQAESMDDNAPWTAGSIMGKTGVGYTGWGHARRWDAEHAVAESQIAAATLGDTPYGPGGSGLFNSYLVPFGHNISVSVEMAGTPGHLVIFWVVLRGRTKAVLSMPGTPSVTLPPTARLRSFYNPTRSLEPLELLPLYNSSAANGCATNQPLAPPLPGRDAAAPACLPQLRVS